MVDGGAVITYGELRLRGDRLARLLADNAGLRCGDRLAVCLPNGWEFAAGLLAAAGIGAVVTPFPTQWRAREIAWLASRLSPRALLADSATVAAWRGCGALPDAVVLVDDAGVRDALLHSPSVSPPTSQPEDAPSVCFPTSGSTGRPRIVFRSARNLVSAQTSTARALGLGAGIGVLSAVPFHHSGGFDNCLLLPLLHGMCATLPESLTAAGVGAAVRDHRLRVLMGSPFLYGLLAEAPLTRDSFATVQTAVSFGAPLPPRTAAECESRLGLRIRQLYGSTETGVIAIQSTGAPPRPGSVGYAVESAEIRILGENGEWLPAGSSGAVAVRGAGVVPGYFDSVDSDAAKFRNGFCLTGDLGRLEPDGELVLCGRSKTTINISGIKVDPAEIEHALLDLPEVRACRVRGVPDERQGEVIEATVELRPGSVLTRRAVVAHCRARLSEAKIPRRIQFAAVAATDAAGKSATEWSDDRG